MWWEGRTLLAYSSDEDVVMRAQSENGSVLLSEGCYLLHLF